MAKKNTEFSIVVEANSTQKEYYKDLFRYRELFYLLAWRDIVVRYKQTFLGILWALIRPLLNMTVFAFVFGKIANLPSGHVSYPLFVLAGMLPWQLFAGCLVDTSNSLLNNAPMISKIYFPRLILPVTHIMVHCVDFFISLLLLLLCLCLGTSLWLSAATVRYRDVRFIVPFLVQFGVFISPVGYSSFLLPETWRWLYFCNPMAGIIEGFRWCCFGIYHPELPLAIALSCLVNIGLLLTGFRFFRKIERVLSDII
jgi:lipopolysaccharide transport system permease protein